MECGAEVARSAESTPARIGPQFDPGHSATSGSVGSDYGWSGSDLTERIVCEILDFCSFVVNRIL